MADTPRGIVLVERPEVRRLEELRGQLEARRDEVASLDGEIEALRSELADFEGVYVSRLAGELDQLSRLRGLVRHLERWVELLRSGERRDAIGDEGRKLDDRREREVEPLQAEREQEQKEPEPEPEPEPEQAASAKIPPTELKAVFRRLVRLCHPDTAQNEEERLRLGRLMRRINALYRAGDVGRLQLIHEQIDAEAFDEALLDDLGVEEQVQTLEDRVAWLGAVVENLRDEMSELEASEIGQLWQQASSAGGGDDMFGALRAELGERLQRMGRDIGWAIGELERAVRDYNKQGESRKPARRKRAGKLVQHFDPFADRALVRLGLQALATSSAGPPIRRQAAWVEGLVQAAPAQLHLLLLAHVCQLTPLPLPGLESWEDLNLRTRALGEEREGYPDLERTLVELSDIVEYGVRRATPQLVHLSLRFRHEATRESMPLALQSAPVRSAFRDVLRVLGEASHCRSCARQVFALPLFRTRGLDDLRATVCPRCGRTLKRYYMPKGDDMQSILNVAYLDLELVTDWSFRLARGSFGAQMLPVEVDALTVGKLKRRIIDDLFRRYELGIKPGHLQLHQAGKRVREKTPLSELGEQRFTVRLTEKSPLTAGDALELLRHRIRNRFT